jgi:O-antigen ligase
LSIKKRGDIFSSRILIVFELYITLVQIHFKPAMSIKKRGAPILIFLLLLVALYFFYVKYVPLVKTYQIFLVPILVVVFLLTSIKKRAGILAFAFCFPLINNLPYFFGINETIPNAPSSLVLFLAFFLGWLMNVILNTNRLERNHPVYKPMILLTLVVTFSGLITFFRHSNFFPFASDKIHDLIVNVNGVTAGGAMMSTVLNFLNYLTGFLFFFIILNTVKSKKFIVWILVVLSFSFFLSLSFSFVQTFHSSGFGNTPFWVNQGRINGTFKDPNSFGAFLSSFIPVLLGLFFFFQKRLHKGFFLVSLILAVFIFPSLGSRSGLIGLGLSVLIFFLLFMTGIRVSLKRKIGYLVLFGLILAILSFSFFFFAQQSNLYKRVGTSLEALSERDSFHQFFTRKLDFWNVASNMIKQYPFTGVGLGSFIIEMPNYSMQMDIPYRFTDSAENYFFQGAAELGLIGLLLFLWLFAIVYSHIFKRVRDISMNGRDKYILYGLAAGTFSLFINFIVHSYIGSFEIKYFFWLLVALIFAYSPQNSEKAKTRTKSSFNRKILAIGLIVLFSGIHLWNSTHSLSIGNRHDQIGWDQSFGLYNLEEDDQGFFFHWTKKTAGLCEKILGSHMIIPIRASHPDLEKVPVNVKIYSANHYFMKQKLLREIELTDTSWVLLEFLASELGENNVYLVFETDRTWQPLQTLGVPDPRWLAIGLGKISYKYNAEIDEKEISESLTVPNTEWEGEFKEKLWRKGESRIKFFTDHPHVALQLNVRVNTAFGWGPYLLVKLDNRILAKCMLNEEGWNPVIFRPEITQGEHELSIEYTNDIHDPVKGENRNVYLGDLKIIYLK